MRKRIPYFLLAGVGLLSHVPATGSPSDVSLVGISSDANADGRAEILAIGADGNLYHRWQVPEGWSFWTLLGSGKYSDAALRLSSDGRLYAFGIDNGQLAIFAQVTRNGGWATDPFRTGDKLSKLSVATDSSGHFLVAALKDGGVWTITGMGDQALSNNRWTDWTFLGGDNLKALSAARDGDGRVVIAALDNGAQLQTVRQVSRTDQRWTRWQSLGAARDGDVALAVSPERTLWLFNTGQKQGLFARSLKPIGPAPEPPNINAQLAGHSPAPSPAAQAALSVIGAGPDPVKSKGLDLAPLKDGWSAPVTIVDQPLFPIDDIVAEARSTAGLDLFASGTHFVSDGAPPSRVTLYSGQQDGGWPANILPGSSKVSTFSRLALSHRGTSDALFAIDRGSGRVFVLTRSGDQRWNDGAWVRLGRVPGPNSPDLAFASLLCLQNVPNIGDAAKIRNQISDGVSNNLKSALGGTSVGQLASDVNALSLCAPGNMEAMGVWLDGEPNPDALIQTSSKLLVPDVVPDLTLFAILLPEATLRSAVEQIWKALPKWQTFGGKAVRPSDADLHLTSYNLELQEPDTIALDIYGRATGLSLDVKAEVRAKFFADHGLPACTASAKADVDPPWLRKLIEGIATGFFMALPDNYFNQLLSKGSKPAGQICTISQAFVSDLYLPIVQGSPPQILEARYKGVEVKSDLGIVGYGFDWTTQKETLRVRNRNPRVVLSVTPLHGAYGKDHIRVKFSVATTDLKGPVKIEWQPSDPEAVRLISPADLKAGTQYVTSTEFEYQVTPSNVPAPYALGAMTAIVTDADKIQAQDRQYLKVFIQPR
jgi:hypothetical protein